MPNKFYLAICAVVATLLFGSMGHAQQSMTLGQLIDRGGKKLAKDEGKRLVLGGNIGRSARRQLPHDNVQERLCTRWHRQGRCLEQGRLVHKNQREVVSKRC